MEETHCQLFPLETAIPNNVSLKSYRFFRVLLCNIGFFFFFSLWDQPKAIDAACDLSEDDLLLDLTVAFG